MATGTQKKTSGKRTTTGKKSTTSKRTTAKKKQQQQESFRNEVILWIVLAVSIIIFIANFGIGGIAGELLSSLVFGVFGLIAYIFPICLFVGTAFALSNRENKIAVVKIIAGILFVSFLCLFVQMVSGNGAEEKLAEVYLYSKERRTGGGVIGGLLEHLFIPAFGKVGSFVIDIIVLIISLVLITERSAFRGMKKGGKVIYNTARDESVRRRGINEQRREERAQLREQKRIDRHVSGVALNETKILPQSELVQGNSDEVNELRIEDLIDMPTVREEKRVPLKSETVNETEIEQPKRNKIRVEPQESVIQPEPEMDFHKLFEDSEYEAPAYTEPTDYESGFADSNEINLNAMETNFMDSHSGETYSANEAEEPYSRLQEPAHDTAAQPEKTQPVHSARPDIAASMAEAETSKRTRNPKPTQQEIAQDISDIQQTAEEISGGTKELRKEYIFPPVSLLKPGSKNAMGDSRTHLQATAQKLQQTLKTFGVNVTITNVSCGPAVTRYELQPEMGVKVSKIVNLADDIKLNLAAADIRIEAPIPGKAAIGIEVPNKESVAVMFRDLVESDDFQNHTSPIAFAAGKDIGGKVIVTDIAKMPHLLIAGATGSGKSVCINTIIMSILYRAHPDDVKLILIDPKVVELSVYNGIPHLFIPVVTEPKKAAGALHWAVAEMTDRYQKFAEYGVRDLKGYNQKVEGIKDIDDPNKPQKMPQIVIIVDELADLMMVAPGDVEDAICRLAQLARAAGIHLIIATQRPSVNVITGLIKANMPSRIAFSVTSGVDSRTILDMNGAEKLLGKGDMLFYPQGMQKPLRVQGAFVTDNEVSDVVDFMKNQNGEAAYSEELETKMSTINTSGGSDSATAPGNDRDVYFADAAKLLIDKDKGSIGMLQRYFKIGFNRAARIMDQLEEAGVVGPDEGTKPRQVLMSPEQLEVYIDENV